MRRPEQVYKQAFDHAFLAYRAQGVSEDMAIDLADRDASEAVDRYCDQKLHLKREGG